MSNSTGIGAIQLFEFNPLKTMFPKTACLYDHHPFFPCVQVDQFKFDTTPFHRVH